MEYLQSHVAADELVRAAGIWQRSPHISFGDQSGAHWLTGKLLAEDLHTSAVREDAVQPNVSVEEAHASRVCVCGVCVSRSLSLSLSLSVCVCVVVVVGVGGGAHHNHPPTNEDYDPLSPGGGAIPTPVLRYCSKCEA